MNKNIVLYHHANLYYEQVARALSEQKNCYECVFLHEYRGWRFFITETERYALNLSNQPELNDMEEILMKIDQRIERGKQLPSIFSLNQIEMFVEKLGGRQHMVICGAGHVAMSILHLGKLLGYYITVIDDRPAFCEQAENAGADEVICGDYAESIQKLSDTDQPYYILVTRSHQFDLDCMHAVLSKRHKYIGMMGSKGRIIQLGKTLVSEGYDQALIDSVHMPIGMKIGAQTPEEIAVAVLAEITMIRRFGGQDGTYAADLLSALKKNDGKKMALAVIVAKKGSGPRLPGTKMLVYEDGRIFGTIGGGTVEAEVIENGLKKMRENGSAYLRLNVTGETVTDHQPVCGGVVDVLIQVLN